MFGHSRGLTRRGFLRLLGAVGGTSMVFGAMDAWGVGIASAQDAPPRDARERRWQAHHHPRRRFSGHDRSL